MYRSASLLFMLIGSLAAHADPAAPSTAPTTVATPSASGIVWQHQLSEIAETQTDANGKQSYFLNASVMDYFLKTIGTLTADYPLQFASQADHDDVKDKLDRIIGALGVMDAGPQTSIEIQRRQAFAWSLAYRFDEPGSAEKAMALYQALLKRTPDEPGANLAYGEFLANTVTLQTQSIPYLQKALQVGAKEANYTLGLVYLQQGDKTKGLACLQQYSQDFPQDQRVKAIIDAVQNGRFSVKTAPSE